MSDKNMKPTFERRKDDWLVGAKRKATAELDEYIGLQARVSYDKDWLHIVTDEYEGAAMLNIEALPALRRALSQIAKERRAMTFTHGLILGAAISLLLCAPDLWNAMGVLP